MTSSFQCRGHRFNPWLEKFHMLWGVAKKKKNHGVLFFCGLGAPAPATGHPLHLYGPPLWKTRGHGTRHYGSGRVAGLQRPCRCPAAVRTWSSLEGMVSRLLRISAFRSQWEKAQRFGDIE